MAKEKAYHTIAVLTAKIAAKLDKVDKGTCSLSEMDKLIVDLRELEERIIIIRYKGMERMRYPEPGMMSPKAKVAEAYRAPELPLETEEEPDDIEEVASDSVTEEHYGDSEESLEAMEEVAPNQISLIDSIEEVSKEASINERMQSRRKKKSVAQSQQSKPLGSILKALNLNQKMGLVNQVFAGDEAKFKSVLESIDSAQDLDSAIAILNAIVTEDQREELAIVRKLDSLIERRFA